jgi:hypothetical protein
LAALTPLSGTATDLTQALFKRADRNGDQKISNDEFGAFLKTILGALDSAAPMAGATASLTAGMDSNLGTSSTDGLPFGSVNGFNDAKMRDLTHVTAKYTASVRLFSQALAATGAQPSAEGLQAVTDWLNAHGATAAATRDRLSINGDAPVDVITDFEGSHSTWWFQNH